MEARIGLPWRIPELVKFYWAFVGLYIVKASIGSVLYVTGVAWEMIACNLEISIQKKPWKGVPEPHDISILEETNKHIECAVE